MYSNSNICLYVSRKCVNKSKMRSRYPCNVSCYKYLGIIIDSGLNFKTMLHNNLEQANRKLSNNNTYIDHRE